MKTIKFKFDLLQKVWIKGIECFGTVNSLWHTRLGNQYEVRYFLNGKIESFYFLEDELSEDKG